MTDEELIELAERLRFEVQAEREGAYRRMWIPGAGYQRMSWLLTGDGMLAVLEAWRNTGMFCCIDLSSDHNFVWDCYWTRTDDDAHKRRSVGSAGATAPEAVARAALAALTGQAE